ncbi:DUF7554 family protein [Natronomonas sp. EA1]|uniref:DUF7554 family protein n=1 Tax=Natronomonas sp. EA1 TaxID=3421655 RepID=UPI003EBF80E3
MLPDARGKMDAEGLLRIILILVVVWIALQIVGEIIDLVFGPFSSIIGLVIIVLIVLWLLDRI